MYYVLWFLSIVKRFNCVTFWIVSGEFYFILIITFHGKFGVSSYIDRVIYQLSVNISIKSVNVVSRF